ncbi:TetR/AcrR family transcriptional regulator [Acetilactobacillus jinshanensis]|uniref:TetR/AcrR family transcriptional regulator n=1 Tax=Acetilactobacillus jinshanensis TaxID=1720083 RepID=A0A4P6ZKH8_9LACO|nr:TetR/AcrR family transcriptional regulator [Acetilactobacillus jinshanensis]QBP17750.1 TetR/AcrR family transcriptional regulator [Acetilactobacillus jinshanensis]URL60611.1 TetR/AcrR family transcriptional regulator [uncultured bacterium]
MRQRVPAKRKIANSLFQLMQHESYQKLQVKQICKAAGISRMTYYRNFRTKDDIIRYSFDQDFTIFIQRVASSHHPTFIVIATIFFNLIKQRQHKMQLIIKNNLSSLMLDRLKYYIGGLIDERVLRTREQSSKLLIAMIAGGLTEILITWTENGMKTPVDSLVIFVSKYMHFKI